MKWFDALTTSAEWVAVWGKTRVCKEAFADAPFKKEEAKKVEKKVEPKKAEK